MKRLFLLKFQQIEFHILRSHHSLNPFIDWKLGVLGSGGVQNLCTGRSQSKKKKNPKRCLQIVFCALRQGRGREGESRGPGPFDVFKRFQMALIRTYKNLSAPFSKVALWSTRREGNWQRKKKKERKKEKQTDTESRFSKGSSNQIFITLLFSSPCFPPLPPALPSLMLVVCRQPSLSGCCVIPPPPPSPTLHQPQTNYCLQLVRPQTPEG